MLNIVLALCGAGASPSRHCVGGETLYRSALYQKADTDTQSQHSHLQDVRVTSYPACLCIVGGRGSTQGETHPAREEQAQRTQKNIHS